MALLFARYLCSRTLGPNGVVNLRLLIHTGTRIAVSFKPSALGVGKPVLDGLVVIGRNPYHKTISFHVLLYVVPTTRAYAIPSLVATNRFTPRRVLCKGVILDEFG